MNALGYMNDVEAAKFLGVCAGTLAVWRCKGRYKVPYIKIGRKVFYKESDLRAWLDSRRHTGSIEEPKFK